MGVAEVLQVETQMPVDVAEGDASFGWQALYRELGETVFRLAHRVTGDEAAAADITHETFLRAATRRRQYAGLGSVHGWVCSIARRLALEHLRRVRIRREEPLRADDRPENGYEARAPEPELVLVVRDLVARLPGRLRVVVLLHDVDGYTHEEIARMLNIAAGSSRARLSRGRAQLRDWLKHAL